MPVVPAPQIPAPGSRVLTSNRKEKVRLAYPAGMEARGGFVEIQWCMDKWELKQRLEGVPMVTSVYPHPEGIKPQHAQRLALTRRVATPKTRSGQ